MTLGRHASCMGRSTTAMVTVAEAGEALGVSESTIWRLIRRGALPSLRRGGRRLIPAAALASRPKSRVEGGPDPLHADHPLFRLVGAGRSGGRGPGARDKHGILDE
jgi:excisionase family DNA binding protein